MNILVSLLTLFATGHAQTATPNLNGIYLMPIQIGERTFRDVVFLEGEEKPISIENFDGKIKGSVTVPGNFSVPLTGTGKCSLREFTCTFDIHIVAKERENTFTVDYRAQMSHDEYSRAYRGQGEPAFHGTAFLENGDKLGDFTGTRIHAL
ncbi:MAG TPA: hypothetical protein VIH99_06255 [Bdellovibrionota bacterium]|jgi:hypothetical protein